MQKANMDIEPGILAMVYGLVVDTECNGLVVEVLFYGRETDEFVWGDEGWICSHDSLFGGVDNFDAKNLMPIRPEHDTVNDNCVVYVTHNYTGEK